MELQPGRIVGPMRPDEVPMLVEWARVEGWNPGLRDAELAWAVDPEAFVAVREGDELVAGGTIFSYEGDFGFMGLFMVKPDLRGAGLGRALWTYRRDRLIARLKPGASIGMDGVFAMMPLYTSGGFRLAYRDVRFEGTASGKRDPDVVAATDVPFEAIDSYDRRHAPAPRTRLLHGWVHQEGALTAALTDGGTVVGYGVLRPCVIGYRFGPLLADTPDAARRLAEHLMGAVSGAPVQLDVPEPNEAAMNMAAGWGMRESFGCARMYHGEDPQLPVERIFGVTSFEFG